MTYPESCDPTRCVVLICLFLTENFDEDVALIYVPDATLHTAGRSQARSDPEKLVFVELPRRFLNFSYVAIILITSVYVLTYVSYVG